MPSVSEAARKLEQAKREVEQIENNVALKAVSLVSGDRAHAYGDIAKSFERIARSWTNILETPVSSKQVALCMMAFKIAREQYQHNKDNLVDICGYAICAHELEKHYGAQLGGVFANAFELPGQDSIHKNPLAKKKRR